MEWELDDSRPIYLQIVEQLEFRIISGAYEIGEKLPSVRDMADEASVNPNTMQRALSELERTGLIYTRRAVGRFITEDTDLIKEIKEEFAKRQVDIFFSNMNKIGFDNAESIEFAEKVDKERES